MITEQQWEQLKEEFGDDAYKRFGFAYMGENIGFANPQCNRDIELYNCPLRSLPEQFKHDIEFYGKNAYLMYKWRNKASKFVEIKKCPFRIPLSNQDVISLLSTLDLQDVERKTSAALPFDLERAKASKSSDVVEWFDNNIWHTVIDIKDIFDSGIDVNFKVPDYENCLFRAKVLGSRLRMKYPPRVEK